MFILFGRFLKQANPLARLKLSHCSLKERLAFIMGLKKARAQKKTSLKGRYFLRPAGLIHWDTKNFLETKAFPAFILLFAAIFFGLAFLSRWTPTEIFPAHTARFLFSDSSSEFLFSLKPLFYFVLWISSLLAKSFDLLPLAPARFLFALNGLLILGLVYFCVKQKANRWSAILSVALLGASVVFLQRGFRIRSDLLLSSLSLFIYFGVLRFANQSSDKKLSAHNKKPYLFLALLGLLPLISPKSLYWLLFMPCFLIHELKGWPWQRQWLLRGAFFISLSFICLSFLLKDPFFAQAIKEAFLYYFLNIKSAFQFIMEWGWIKTMSEWSHLFMFIEKNPFLALIIGVKLLFVIHRVFSIKEIKQPLFDAGFLILLSVFCFHPQQKMFFLCALSPFFIILFFTDPKWLLLQKKYSGNFKVCFLAGALLYGAFAGPLFAFEVYNEKNNFSQKKTIQILNDFYENAPMELSIFDPNCLLYKRKTTCRYILYKGQERLSLEFEPYFKEKNFDIVLSSRALDIFRLEGLNLKHKKEALCVEKDQNPQKKDIEFWQGYRAKISLSNPIEGLIFDRQCLKNGPPAFKRMAPDTKPLPFAFSLKTKADFKAPINQARAQYIQLQNHIFYKALVFDPYILRLLSDSAHKTSPFEPALLGAAKSSGPIGSWGKTKSLLTQKELKKCPAPKDSSKTRGVLGARLAQSLLSDLDLKALGAYKRWFYFYLDSSGRILNPIPQKKDHLDASRCGGFLCLGRPYSLAHFQSGCIPFKNKALALFYLPFPWDLPVDLLLRDQFRYDLY